MRSLEDVLKDLNDAEKEYKSKCEKYGIEEKSKRKPKVVEENPEQANLEEKSESEQQPTEAITDNQTND